MKRSPRELRDGTILKLKNLFNTTGNNLQPISTILPSSKIPNLLSPRPKTSKKPMLYAASVTLSPQIISLLQVLSPKIHQLPDTSEKRESRTLISTLMVPEEETMKLWLEELSQILESSIN